MTDKYQIAIENNFPNTSLDEVSPAYIAGELRALLREEDKIKNFPNKKELIHFLAQTAKEALPEIDFKYLKSTGQLKIKSKEFIDVLGHYFVNGNVDPNYSTRFLSVEKIINDWVKTNKLDYSSNRQYYVYTSMKRFYNFREIRFSSYFDLSQKYYERLKKLSEIIIPKHEQLKEIGMLNQFLNYGESEFNVFNGGGRSHANDKRKLISKPIVAVLAKDKNADKIFEKEVGQFITDQQERIEFESAFEKLKEEYGI